MRHVVKSKPRLAFTQQRVLICGEKAFHDRPQLHGDCVLLDGSSGDYDFVSRWKQMGRADAKDHMRPGVLRSVAAARFCVPIGLITGLSSRNVIFCVEVGYTSEELNCKCFGGGSSRDEKKQKSAPMRRTRPAPKLLPIGARG